MSANHFIPEQFAGLAPLAETWALATESERNEKRRSSAMADLQAFYGAMLPRMDEIIAYLNQFPPDEMPEGAERLFYMALSFMEVSLAVELFGEPDETDVFEAARFKIVECAIA